MLIALAQKAFTLAGTSFAESIKQLDTSREFKLEHRRPRLKQSRRKRAGVTVKRKPLNTLGPIFYLRFSNIESGRQPRGTMPAVAVCLEAVSGVEPKRAIRLATWCGGGSV